MASLNDASPIERWRALATSRFSLYDWTKAATVGVVLLGLGVLFVTFHRYVSGRGLRGYG